MSDQIIGDGREGVKLRKAARSTASVQRNWNALANLDAREELSAEWLSLVVGMMKGVKRGLVLLREAEGEGFLPTALWPLGGEEKIDAMAPVVQKALREGQASFLVEPDKRTHVAQPLLTEGKAWGVIVLEVEPRSEERLRAVMLGLQASSGWLRVLDPHQQNSTADEGDAGARLVLESIAILPEKNGFKAAALGLVTRLEKELQCERVSLGMMSNLRVTINAVSTSPQFVEKSNLVRSMETVMEEACDQEVVIQHPVLEGDPFVASIAHRAHARAYGHRSILSVPFDRNGEIVGALMLERPEGDPFTEEEVLAVEAISALAGPHLDLAWRDERWIGAKLSESFKKTMKAFLGTRKRALRFAVGSVSLFVFIATFWQTDYRVTSDVFLEAQKQQLLSAPIPGYVSEAPARAGDIVSEGDLLYSLDDTELRLNQERLMGEESQISKRHLQAMALGTAAEVRILVAQLGQIRAQLALAEEQLSQVSALAPFDGVIVSGDLTQSIGLPIERGQVVFSIAPMDDFRVVLQVADESIDECAVGQEGVLLLTAMPKRPFPFLVSAVMPVAESAEGVTYFRVEATLLEGAPVEQLRPGMEGVGKISVGDRGLLWTWTHSAFDSIRLLWWKWTP